MSTKAELARNLRECEGELEESQEAFDELVGAIQGIVEQDDLKAKAQVRRIAEILPEEEDESEDEDE